MNSKLDTVHTGRIGTAVALLMLMGPAWAQQRSFDVPATEAVKAIPEFARQAGIQIVAPARRATPCSPFPSTDDDHALLTRRALR